jgi:hypothetical protein
MTKVNPPGFGKKNGSRTYGPLLEKIKDRYKMDGDRIVLQGLGAIGWIEVRYKGPIHLRGDREELRIRYAMIEGSDMLTLLSRRSPRRWWGRVEAGAAAAERQPDRGHRHRDKQFNGNLCRE